MNPVTIAELDRISEILHYWKDEARVIERDAVKNQNTDRAKSAYEARHTMDMMLGLIEDARMAGFESTLAVAPVSKSRKSVLVAGSYASYAKRLGYAPLRGKSKEFEQLAHVLYDLNTEAKYLALYDPEGRYDSVIKERDGIAEQLGQISKTIPPKEVEG